MSFLATAADPTTVVTAAGALLDTIYPIVIGAVSFGVLIAIVKMVKKR